MAKRALAIHGGAGTILRSLMTEELENEYRSGLEDGVRAGWKILEKGGSSLEAVEAAVCSLEDFPLFNAGRGSVFTHDGKNEMDASIMSGGNLRAGAVAFVKNVKNPVKLARLVMERTEHVLLAGAGANQFALEANVEMADDAYFFTEHRYEQLLKARGEGIVQLDHASDEQEILEQTIGLADLKSNTRDPRSLGTVGAVACDLSGDLAAATSTGGMTNKKFGRIGDTPLIGAGTYADNQTCAVSCTGHGEFFMLASTAYDVAARMKYQGMTLPNAAKSAVEYLLKIGGEGGLVAVDNLGNVALPFNCEGMYRAWMDESGRPIIQIYK